MGNTGRIRRSEARPSAEVTAALFTEKGKRGAKSDWPAAENAKPWQIIGGSPKEFLAEPDLNGSWYLQLRSEDGDRKECLSGPLRLHRTERDLAERFGPFLISSDLYGHDMGTAGYPEPLSECRLDIHRNWYPQLPWSDYFGHFKCKQDEFATYKQGELRFSLDHFLWDRNWFPNFDKPEVGVCVISCPLQVVIHPRLPQPTLRVTGHAMIGERRYGLVATKTSPLYRGCRVEVDVMADRFWPAGAHTADGHWRTFADVFREAGIDIRLSVSKTDIPSDPDLKIDELLDHMSRYREFAPDRRSWRLWMLVASTLDLDPMKDAEPWFGVMFDKKVTDRSWRDGVAVFYDPPILLDTDDRELIAPDLEGKRLGDVDVAFLRTALHEAGHAFSLIHTVDDFWQGRKSGRTIMNQTGDVKRNATKNLPFPENIELAFEPQNTLFLTHSPDPKMAPGWSRGQQSDAIWPEFILKRAP